MAEAQAVLGVGREHMRLVEIEKMLVFDACLGVIPFLEEGFRPLHDDMRVVVALQRILLQHLLVGVYDVGDRRISLRLRGAGAAGGRKRDGQHDGRES